MTATVNLTPCNALAHAPVKKQRLLLKIFAAAMSFLGILLSAEVSSGQTYTVWNTFQEPGDISANSGYTINGSASAGGSYQGIADSFTPSASGDLYSVSLAVFELSGSGGINVYVAANNGSQPGTILESFLNVSPTGNPMTLDSVATPLLRKGVTYWLYVEPAEANTDDAWNDAVSNPTVSYTVDGESAPGAWATLAPSPSAQAFDIVLVPEPSTWSLLLGGLALGAILSSRRRRGESSSSSSSSSSSISRISVAASLAFKG